MDTMIGHNLPPVDERARKLADTAERWIKDVPEITNDDAASRCRDFLDQVKKEIKAIDDRRRAEKAPIIAAGKAIDEKYNAPKMILEQVKVMIEPKLRLWLIKLEERRRSEAEEKAAAAREAERIAGEKRAALEQTPTIAASVDAVRADQDAARAEQEARSAHEPARVRGSVTGRASSLRSRKVAVLEDVNKALRHFKKHPDVIETITRLANAELRHGAESVPGFRVEIERIAV